jgi:hypothetical protein
MGGAYAFLATIIHYLSSDAGSQLFDGRVLAVDI